MTTPKSNGTHPTYAPAVVNLGEYSARRDPDSNPRYPDGPLPADMCKVCGLRQLDDQPHRSMADCIRDLRDRLSRFE
jgi:hypothetical protein